MKTIRFILFLAASGLAFAPAAQGAEPPAAADAQLVGIWQEFSPSSNVTEFFADHTMRIYLTKEDGARMNMHWIEGKWTLSPERVLTLSFSVKGETFSESAKLKFENNEMWLTQEGTTTKSRRLAGDLPPEKYRWH